MDATFLLREAQPLEPANICSDDYDELLLLLRFGLNSLSLFRSKTKLTNCIVFNEGTEHSSQQPLFESLQVFQDCCQIQNSKDQGNDNGRTRTQFLNQSTISISNPAGQGQDPYVAMFQDFYQIPSAWPNTL